MPEPEKVDASSQPLATGMQQQQSYKSLLNQQIQKLRKQAPVYQTNNEGSEHQPKFRTTIWVDGVSYTSPNTFQNRKLAETDASRITLFAIIQKLKTEASHHVLEDKFFCKAILMEYAVRMNIQRPIYQTTKLGSSSSLPLFRSCLVFNNASFTGDECRTKKEAEQSAARVVILKNLDSETGIMLSEIIKSKFNHTLIKDIQIPQSHTNVAMNPSVDITQETPLIQTPTETPPTQTVLMPTDMTQTQTPTPAVCVTNNAAPISAAATSLGHFVSIPATQASNNGSVVQPIKSEAPVPPVTVAASSLPITGKKRKSKNKKNAEKRMRAQNQLQVSAMFHGQVPTFSAQ